jgi:HAD superfamily hydrolase (TIGR01509 family)
MATHIKAVIFDMDGVLCDSEALICTSAVEMFGELGVTVQRDDFVPFVGTGEDRYIGGVAEKYGVSLNLPKAKARTYEFYLSLVPTTLEAFPGAVELVKQCRAAGMKTAVASSADLVKIKANLNKIRLPIETWNAITSSEDVVKKKPAPDIFLAAARKLRAEPAECVVIEDAVAGVEAARAAKMRCIAVAHTFPAEKLRAADLLRRHISEVSLADIRG